MASSPQRPSFCRSASKRFAPPAKPRASASSACPRWLGSI